MLSESQCVDVGLLSFGLTEWPTRDDLLAALCAEESLSKNNSRRSTVKRVMLLSRHFPAETQIRGAGAAICLTTAPHSLFEVLLAPVMGKKLRMTCTRYSMELECALVWHIGQNSRQRQLQNWQTAGVGICAWHRKRSRKQSWKPSQ